MTEQRTSLPDYPHVGIGWAFPVRWDSTGVRAVDNEEEQIRQAIRIVIRTNLGSRVMRPTYGADVERYVFAPRTDQVCFQLAFDVERALLLYEPRIIVDEVVATPAGEAEDRIDVSIDYRIDRHRRPSNLVLPFYLQQEGS